jgi:hypothetical protein
MEKEFVIYSLALRMKKLGYNGPCLGYYTHNEKLCSYGSNEINIEYLFCTYKDIYKTYSLAPTFSQAFRWFREKYQIDSWIYPNLNGLYSVSIVRRGVDLGKVSEYQTYPEAELACLKKILEIVEQTNAEMTDHGVYK